MPKSTIISQEVIIETAFEMVRQEGFSVLSARNIAKKIGCSTQPIYWCYKNMDDLKAEICKKGLRLLKNTISEYKKTGNPFLDLGLGYVYMAHAEPALFKAFYMATFLNVFDLLFMLLNLLGFHFTTVCSENVIFVHATKRVYS